MSYFSARTYTLVLSVSNVTESDNGTYVVHLNNLRIGVALVVLRKFYCFFSFEIIYLRNK